MCLFAPRCCMYLIILDVWAISSYIDSDCSLQAAVFVCRIDSFDCFHHFCGTPFCLFVAGGRLSMFVLFVYVSPKSGIKYSKNSTPGPLF